MVCGLGSVKCLVSGFTAAVFLLCAAAVLPAGAAEGEKEGVDSRVTLRIVVPQPQITAPWERAGREIFNEFVRTHPEINVVPAQELLLEGGGNAAILLAVAGGVSPDVFSLFYMNIQSYVEQGFVAPIDEYLKDWEMEPEVPDQLWQVVTGADGRRYGAIYTWPTVYLVYRRDLFEEVGLDPDRRPQNWDELFDYAQRLSNPDMVVETALNPNAGYGRMGLYLQPGSWIWSSFIWQAGGDIVRKRDGGRWEAVFDSPGGVRALEFYHRLRWTKWTRNGKEYTGVVRPGLASDLPGEYARNFGRGEVAMAIMPLRRLQDVLEAGAVPLEAIGVAPLPAGPTGIRASIVDGDAWCITGRVAGDRRKMDAAWEFIRFATSDRAHEIETRVYVEAGWGKFVRNPRWLEEFGYHEYFRDVDPQHLAAFDETLKYGRPEPHCPGYESISTEMDIPISRILRDPDANAQAELKSIVRRINTYFFKLYPEDEMRFKRRVGVVLAIVFAAALCWGGYLLVKSLSRRLGSGSSGLSAALKASRWKHLYAWLFLLPAVACILLWDYLPLVRGSVMSVYDYRILGGSTYVGLDNFIEAVGQPVFWKSLYNTFLYMALTMSFGFVVPIVLALFLSEVPRLKITFRVLFYLPALTSSLVLMFLWKNLLYEPSPVGVLNRILGFFGIPPQTWLLDPNLAMFSVVLPAVWAGAGPGSIIYLAALKTVPDELYEAAEMDGAGPLQKIRLVTLPYLRALIMINFLGAFIGSFHATQNIFVMTMGGPEQATHTLSLEIFFNAFLYLKMGYATAMAWILGSMLIGFTLYQLRLFQRVEFTAGASGGPQ